MTQKQWQKIVAASNKMKAAMDKAGVVSSTLQGRYWNALYELAQDDADGPALLVFKNGFDRIDLISMLDKIREEFEAENGKEQG